MLQIAPHVGLTQTQFESLFSEDASKVDASTLDELASTAAQGNTVSIDMLLNLALRKDGIGEMAQSKLVELHGGERSDIRDMIGQGATTLFEKVDHYTSADRMAEPSALHHMAYSSPHCGNVAKQEIRQMFEITLNDRVVDTLDETLAAHISHGQELSDVGRPQLYGTRTGLADVCSDTVMSTLDQMGLSSAFQKVNIKEHSFVLSKDQQTIIEPSYKQKFLKPNADPEDTRKLIGALRDLPDVFYGSKMEFDATIDNICANLGIKGAEKDALKAHWDTSRVD